MRAMLRWVLLAVAAAAPVQAPATETAVLRSDVVPGYTDGTGLAQEVNCPAPAPGRLFEHGFEALPGGNLTVDGPFAVATTSGTALRQSRSTPWIAQFPAGTTTPRPMLVLLPEAGVPLGAYESLASHLATHGFIAVRAAPELNLFAPDHLAMALDLGAVVDALLVPGELPVSVDASRVAAGGHGVGGKVAIMAAAGDSRIRAVLLLDPVNAVSQAGHAPSIVPEPTDAIALPMALLGQLTDTAGAMACTPAELNYQVIFDAATASPRGYEWTIPGAAHFDFISDPEACGLTCEVCLPPTAPIERTRAFIRAASVAFLRAHLELEASACEWLTGERLPGGIEVRQRTLP